LNTFHTSCPITHKDICDCSFLESKETKENILKNSKFVYQLYTHRNPEFEKEFGKTKINHKVSIPTRTIQDYLPVTRDNKKKRKREDLKLSIPTTPSTTGTSSTSSSTTPIISNVTASTTGTYQQQLHSPIFIKNQFLPILASPSSTIQFKSKIPISPISSSSPSMLHSLSGDSKFETPKKKVHVDTSSLKKSRGRPSKKQKKKNEF